MTQYHRVNSFRFRTGKLEKGEVSLGWVGIMGEVRLEIDGDTVIYRTLN